MPSCVAKAASFMDDTVPAADWDQEQALISPRAGLFPLNTSVAVLQED